MKIKKTYLSQQLKRLIIGGVFGWLVYFVSMITDSVVGGLYFDEAGLSAITIIAPVYSFIYFVSCFVSTGCGLFRAQAIGENNQEKADSIFSTGFIASLCLGIITGILLIVLKDTILSLYKLSEEVYLQASAYYDPFIGLSFFLPLAMFIYTQVSTEGRILIQVITDVAETSINLGLSLILGKTSLGVMGLSIATTVSYLVYLLIPTIHFFSKRNTCHLNWKFKWEYLIEDFKLGFSSYVITLSIAVLDLIMDAYICAKFGDLYAAPYALVNFVLSIATGMVLVSYAMIILLDFSVGENNIVEMKQIVKLTKKYGTIVSVVSTIAMLLFTPFLYKVYSLTTPEFIGYSYLISITFSFSFLFSVQGSVFSSFYLSQRITWVGVLYAFLAEFVFPLILPIALASIFNSYNAFLVGFALVGPLAFITITLILYFKNNKVILKYPVSLSTQDYVDFLCQENTSEQTINNVKRSLEGKDVSSSTATKILSLVEEILKEISKRNNHKRKAYGVLYIQVTDNKVVLIEKDEGVTFDILNKEDNSPLISSDVLNNFEVSMHYISASRNANRFEINR